MKELATISGTAFDGFGISSVTVLIRDFTRGATYWNGTSWVDTDPSGFIWPLANWNGAYWTFTSTPTWQDQRRYRVWSKAYDNAGEVEGYDIAYPDEDFRYDITRPVSIVTSTAPGTTSRKRWSAKGPSLRACAVIPPVWATTICASP